MRQSLSRKVRSSLEAWSRPLPRSVAIALDQLPADPEDAGAIRAAQIDAIVRVSPFVMAASCINAVIVLATFAAMGALRPEHWVWAILLFAMAFRFVRAWAARRGGRRPTASRRAIRSVIVNGAAFGALWGALPAAAFPGAPLEIQLFVACVAAGMMSAGAFVLSAVPLAGSCFVLMVAAGALYALAQEGSPIYLGLVALLASYSMVIVAGVNWTAGLLVDSLLAEAQVRREIAARERAQAVSAHAERITALGQLAGGIAHDFNNVLQVVGGGAARIERNPGDRENAARQARRIQDAVERGSAVSRRLLTFARRDALSAEAIDAGALLADLGELLTHTIGSSIRIRVDVDGCGWILADRRRLETVVLNLATNARDAMPDGGDLVMSATPVDLSTDGEPPHLKAGRYVRITVADTGTGMTPEVLARAAEPFFTTKPKGMGTGLGVSMAAGFAEQSGGAFAIASAPGEGATVTLWLPQADPGPLVHPTEGAGETAAGPQAGLGWRVLVVDDDDLVREVLATALEDAGFTVSSADGGARALAIVDRGTAVDAMITDFAMPGMSGVELVHEVHARRPGLPAILLTGHVGDVAASVGDHVEAFALLQKPVDPAKLVHRLLGLLSAVP